MERLYYWAEFAEEPLRSYATGLLSGAMELNDVAVKFREESLHLVSFNCSFCLELKWPIVFSVLR